MLRAIGDFKPVTFVVGVSVCPCFWLLARRYPTLFLMPKSARSLARILLGETAPIVGGFNPV